MLNPVEALRGDDAMGQAVVSLTDGDVLQLVVQARLPKNAKGEAYDVWLYNSDEDALSLGAQVTNDQGLFQGTNKLPRGNDKYRFVDVSREPIAGPKSHSGASVLRGDISKFKALEPGS